MAYDFHGCLHMAFHGTVLLIRQFSGFIQYVFRYPYFSDIVKQGRLLKNLLVFLAGFQGLSHGMGVVGHILGMLECIMVLCVNGSCQGIDGGSILRIHASVLLCQSLVRIPHPDDSVRVYPDSVLSGTLHMVYRTVCVGYELIHGRGCVRSRADSAADSQGL